MESALFKICLEIAWAVLTVDTDDLLLRDAQLSEMQRAPPHDHWSVFSWIHNIKPLADGQYNWIFHHYDFVSLKKSSDWVWLEVWPAL